MSNLKEYKSLVSYTKVDLVFKDLIYNQEFKTIICTICKYSLGLLNNILRHLKETHYNKDEFNLIKNQLSIILNKLDILENKDLYIPANNKYNFKDLINYQGYLCLVCNYITINYKGIRQHLNLIHNIKANNTINNKDYLFKYYKFPCIIQSFVGNRKDRKYFITNNNIINNLDLNNTNSNILLDFKSKVNNIIKEGLDNKPNLSTKEISPFLYNSKFNEYLINKDKLELLTLLKKPLNNNLLKDQIINLLYTITLNLIYKLEPLVQIINRSYKQKLNTEILNSNIPNLKPFKIVEESTKKVYNIIFPNYLIYLFNLYYIRLELKGKSLEILEPNIDLILDNILKIIDLITIIINNNNLKKEEDNKESILLIEKLLINLFIKLLIQDTKQKSFNNISLFNSSIFTYLILISINPNSLTFKNEIYIEQYTSQLIYNFRLVFLGFLKIKEEESKEEEINFDFDFEFNKYLALFLTNTSYNIFTELTQIRALTSKISSTTTSASRIIDINNDIIAIDNKQISINKLKDYFQVLLNRLEDLLFNNLIFLNIKEIDLNLDLLKDDQNNNTLGFSFLNYINQNQDLTIYKDLLINKLLNKETLISQKLLKDINTLTFNSENIKLLYNNKTKFLELLFFSIYLTSGSLLRGNKLIIVNYFNTLTQLFWNILIKLKQPEFIKINTTYNKSFNINRINKTNIRFLNNKLSKILKIYLIFFIPLYNFININYFNIKEISPKLFENKGQLFTISTLSNLLNLETLKYLGESISINPYRHLIKYIIKERLLIDNNKDYFNSSSSEDLIEDIQANHTTYTSNLIYSREINTDSNSSNYILKKSLEFNIKFFTYFNLLETSLNNNNNNNNNVKKHIRNQSNINLQVNKKSKLNINYNSSDLESKAINNNNNKERIITRNLLDINLLEKPSLEIYLQRFFNNNKAKFNNIQQKQAIQAILNKEPFITYISRTSTGKSLLFFLPYYINSNIITLVISPRLSLKEDLYNHSIKYNIKGEIFNSQNRPNSNLLFLGFEDLETSQFKSYINNLIANNQEFNIYFDEAHLIILKEDFRYIIKYINKIIKFKNNIVFISATLPNLLLTLLEAKFNITNNTIIRGTTSRANISYNIQYLNKNENIINKLKYLFNILLLKLKDKEKIIIFTTTEESCNYISKQLDILKYYSKLENKSQILNSYLTNNNNKAIVTTNALGVGLDYSFIRYSIHPYKINSLINLDQEIGRIGRDQEPNIAYIFVNLNNYYYKTNNNNNNNNNNINLEALKIQDNNKIVDFIKETRCYRIILNNYFNNQINSYCIDPNSFCSLCLNRKTTLENSKILLVNKEIIINSKINSLIILLTSFKTICFVCLLEGLKDYNNHYLYNCLNPKAKEFIFIVRDIEKNYIKKERLLKIGSCCFQCFLPNSICFNKTIKLNNCQLQYTVLESIIFINQLSNKYKNHSYIKENFTIILNTKSILELSKLIVKPIIYFNSEAINALTIIETINIDLIYNIIINKSNPNI